MKQVFRSITEGLARRTTRRGLFGRGAQAATGALLGVAAGTVTRPGSAGASHIPSHTVCAFPGPPCPCDGCMETGSCAKPCTFVTTWYASGCWVTGGVTCCDCQCNGFEGINQCGCGTDYHNNPTNCP